jgi:hypothetical protein
VALLTALLASALSIGLGMALVLLSIVEATLAAHDRDARALRYAAQSAAAIAVSDLRALPSWTGVGAPGASAEVSAATGRFVDASLTPVAPWGGALDLRSLTARIQAESEGATGAGVPRPQWRLFIYGPSSSAMPAPGSTPCYLAAWVADDRNVVLVHAVALGRADARIAVEIALVRQATASGEEVRILSVRPGS